MGNVQTLTRTVEEKPAVVVQGSSSFLAAQGPEYTPGISADTAGAEAIWLGKLTLPPGMRITAHSHPDHETAHYFLEGDEVELWTGDRLQHHQVARPGDFIYIPAGMPHVAVNRSGVPAVFIGCRTDPKAVESLEMLPDLDSLVP